MSCAAVVQAWNLPAHERARFEVPAVEDATGAPTKRTATCRPSLRPLKPPQFRSMSIRSAVWQASRSLGTVSKTLLNLEASNASNGFARATSPSTMRRQRLKRMARRGDNSIREAVPSVRFAGLRTVVNGPRTRSDTQLARQGALPFRVIALPKPLDCLSPSIWAGCSLRRMPSIRPTKG